MPSGGVHTIKVSGGAYLDRLAASSGDTTLATHAADFRQAAGNLGAVNDFLGTAIQSIPWLGEGAIGSREDDISRRVVKLVIDNRDISVAAIMEALRADGVAAVERSTNTI